jgi:PTH1 family peptidyl-tRNA hydrolase
MKLIVGLGNPGKKYEKTRHNMGFMTVDLFSDVTGIDIDKEAFNGLLGRGKFLNEDVILLKPQTFMNLSGNCVQQVVHFFKIALEDIIIIYDDMALPPGTMRMRLSGSSGGQKGMQNIIEMLSTEEIKRIRIGIGEPEDNSIDYVLSKPTKDEQILIDEAINRAVEALKECIRSNFQKAMSLYN